MYWPLSDTIYWFSSTAKFSPIGMSLAGIASSIPKNTLSVPILPISFIIASANIDRLTSSTANSWIFTNPMIQDSEQIPYFLMDFSYQSGLMLDKLIPWILGLEVESERVQMSVIRYWQTWLYFKQASDNKSRTFEPIPLPSPYISVEEDTSILFNLQHMLSRVDTAKDNTEIQYSIFHPSADRGNTP